MMLLPSLVFDHSDMDLTHSAKGLAESAHHLSKDTGRRCLPATADVRNQEALKGAVDEAVKEFGRIDFVICGAAGNL